MRSPLLGRPSGRAGKASPKNRISYQTNLSDGEHVAAIVVMFIIALVVFSVGV